MQYTAFFIYFAILLTIGLTSRRKNTSEADFVMGNRSMNFWVTALSAHSSDMSAWLFMGLPGAVFLLGASQAWVGIGLIAGMWANWQWIAPRLREMTEKYDSYTLATFFERRFNDNSGIIRFVSCFMAVLFLTCYLTGGIVAIGYLVEALFHFDYAFGVLVMMPVLMLYVLLGGYVAVAWVDFFQGIFLFVVILLVPLIAYQAVGGWNAIEQMAVAQEIDLELIPTDDPLAGLCALLFGVGWGLGYFGQPHIITKFMGIKNVSDLKKSKYLGMTWQIIALTASIMIGLIGIAYFPLGLLRHEMVFIDMVKSLFSPFMASFFLCGVIAANMSTTDSQVLVISSMISEDLFRKWFKGEGTEEFMLLISRWSVFAISAIATTAALYIKSYTIFDIVGYAWSGLGATFGPIVLAALYGKHVNRYGIIAGLISGGSVAALWPVVGPLLMDNCIMPIIPGFLISSILICGVSRLTRHG